MNKYTEVREIGHGSFGRAVLVKLKTTQEDFVVKKIRSELMSAAIKEEAAKEVAILKQLQHENIVAYIESFEERGCLHIVMTYCSEGNLAMKIRARRNLFPEQEIVSMFRQLCQAVDYMHSKNILHRDIKPENIFFTKEGILKLGDFGLSKVLDTTLEYARTMAGTLCYMSPEILDAKQYKNKSDMWSLGCVLYEITTLKRAFTSISGVIGGKFTPVSSDYSNDIQDLITELLSKKPEERPSASEVLAMGFIRVKNDKISAPLSSCISDFDLFLIGGRGNGRSATGNTILGIHGAFKESHHFEAEESQVTDVKWCRRGKQILKVVDGPCLMEGRSKHKIPVQAFVHCSRGFHVLLFVLNFANPRLTAEDKFVITFMKQTLGKDILKNHGIVIITHGECFDLYTSRREWMMFDTWCQKQEGSLGELIKECENRVVLFYNLTPNKREESVNKLISTCSGISKFFTCNYFKGVRQPGDSKLEDSFVLPESVLGRMDLCLNDIRSYLDLKRLADYQHLKDSALHLLAEISNQDLNSLLLNIQSLVNPLAGRERITVQKLQDTLYALQKIQEPYRRIVVRNSHGVSKCSIA